MKEVIRTLLKPVLSNPTVEGWIKKRYLFKNFQQDAELFHRHATAYNEGGLKNKEANLILNYHSLEKGMLFNKMKRAYGQYRICNLHQLLTDEEVIKHIGRSQIRVGYEVMCKYYELQQANGYDISGIFSKAQYELYKTILGNYYNAAFSGTIDWTIDQFYKDNQSNFEQFSSSRKSVRNFTGEKVPREILEKVITLANNAPSVCNRQASNVYVVEDKNKIDQILKIQDGFTGYTENVNQLIILTNDRHYYYTPGERNQLYIDGGLYLLNLLYALHYYKVANCPANWAKTIKQEEEIYQVIALPRSEKIICLVPIGYAVDEFKTTLSLRRPSHENLEFIT